MVEGINDPNTGRFVKGKKVPLERQCDYIRRSNGEKCTQHHWRVTGEGKKLCRFHDRVCRNGTYKGQRVKSMTSNYRNLSSLLDKFLGSTAERADEVKALGLLEEVAIMRASHEQLLKIGLSTLASDAPENQKHEVKQNAVGLVTMCVRQIEASVLQAARVRQMVSGVISPQQVRQVVDQLIVIIRDEFREDIEVADRIAARLWAEVKLPTGEGKVEGSNLTPADTLVSMMDASVPFVPPTQEEGTK